MKGVIIDTAKSIADTVKYVVSMNSFSEQCSQRLGIEVKNFGKFGSTVSHGVAAVERYIDQIGEADYAILEYGGNDCDFHWEEIGADPQGAHTPKTTISDFIAKYETMLDKIKGVGATPVLLSLPPLASGEYFNYFSRKLNDASKSNIIKWLGGTVETINNWHEMYNLEVFKLAMMRHVPIIDITSAFLNKRDYKEYLCDDGIHPNEKGHRLIADVVCDYFTKNLDKINATKILKLQAV